MSLTDRDKRVLAELHRSGPLLTSTIRDEFFPTDKAGAITRGRLRKMREVGLVHRTLVVIGKPWDNRESGSWKLTELGKKVAEEVMAEMAEVEA